MGADDHGLDALLASQREFYDLRAPDFGNAAVPDRRVFGELTDEQAGALVGQLGIRGDVLELACGSGAFTRHLLRHARTVTAVDASPRMLERNRREVGDDRVSYVHADLFAWRPDRQFDSVFFGFWLSHVPPTAFESFWGLVRSSLRSGGCAAFVDEDDRAAGFDEVRSVDGVPVAPRTLRDGRRFDIVKVFWKPDELETRLRDLGWEATVHRAGESLLTGVAA